MVCLYTVLSYTTLRDTTWDGRVLTSLVGLAPWSRDSGKKRGNRSIRGGRGTVRRALYICAWVVLRVDGDLRDFYQRLRERGKPVR